MAIIRLTHTINRPVADVFAAIADIASYPNWHPSVRTATKLTDGPIRVGTRFRGTSRPFGRLDMVVKEYEEPERFKTHDQAIIATVNHLLLLTSDGESTRVEHIVETKARGLGLLIGPLVAFLVRRTLRNGIRGLSRYLESSIRRP